MLFWKKTEKLSNDELRKMIANMSDKFLSLKLSQQELELRMASQEQKFQTLRVYVSKKIKTDKIDPVPEEIEGSENKDETETNKNFDMFY